ncbi:YaiI/YqxD family protein [Vagococcus intermedius]|uniref:UPF0178 protein OL234_09515 n=1 Tax=Vagococcus intermedius TaxID=2991418 RepID=A0AAF0I976_9ENTE|nr:YaiI/YqxD family protein [Vagococcus intermedius]WEG73187.1 YaiI/YqxD family protein [Vagococcus intermedius]WEG75272.1 YaiI/YqxD family protein [Vagococcus intermedius]
MRRLFIDGDACPVKDIVIKVGGLRQLEVVIVASFSHYSTKELPQHVSIQYVDAGADAADYRLVALLVKGDILITQDYGLAALALPKGVRVLHHTGYEYTADKIDVMLESRYFNAKVRKSGKRTKGPKKLTELDKKVFHELLVQVLSE